MTERKIFSLEEANRVLARISPLMARVQTCLLEIGREMNKIGKASGRDPVGLSPLELTSGSPLLRRLFEDLHHNISEIESYGCHFKGLKLGLVDFPALLGGEEVFLCWQYGEPEVLFWHPIDAGFGGRRAIRGKSGQHFLH